MNEKKIVLILVAVISVIYLGIEPIAHAIMHPIPDPDFAYSDLEKLPLTGDAKKGQDLVRAHCIMCHNVSVDLGASPLSKKALSREFGDAFDANSQESYAKFSALSLSKRFGVVPLDLSNVGLMYDKNFLANFIKRPAHASFESSYIKHKTATYKEELDTLLEDYNHTHEVIYKFKADFEATLRDYKAEKKISMPDFKKLKDQQIGDIIAYLDLISRDLSPKEATELACGRCHSVALGKIVMTTQRSALKEHFGTIPPDLSMMYKSRGEEYLHTFLNDPQSVILGSKMPRIGLNKPTQDKVISYLESVADPKKEERESLAWWVIGYFIFFAIVSYLWYRNEHERIHD